MNVIQRYVFRRLSSAFVTAFPALTISIWLTQSLGELNLVTNRGQGFGVFIEAAPLLLPSLLLIIGPISMLIVVITTVNWLNADSELVSVEANGAPRTIMLKPVLALAVPVALLSTASSLYLSPYAERSSASLVEEVNANVITTIIRPGEFRALGDDVVMQAAAIHPDGTLEGIFVFDRRLVDETVAYIADAGALVENDLGQFLLMQDGVIQRQTAATEAVSTIQFRSYAFDLSTLSSQSIAGDLRPNQRPLDYLLNPDRNDPIYQDNPYRYTAELHNRLTMPLYALALALLPLAILGQVRTARQGGGKRTAFAGVAGIAVLMAGLTLQGALWTNPRILAATYGVPVGVIVFSLLYVWSGKRLPSFGFLCPARRFRSRRVRAT